MKHILTPILLLTLSSAAYAQQAMPETNVNESGNDAATLSNTDTQAAPAPSAADRLIKQAVSDLKQNTTFGGYIIGQAKFNDQDGNDVHSNMDIRLVRVYAKGKVLDFAYNLQVQVNGTNGSSPYIVDAWTEWQKYDFARIKFGQFKRAYGFENPMNPWDIGAGGYSQLTTKLVGFKDRVGEHSSNGRDIGLQIQGDLLPVGADRHNLVHYQVGVYNGQGVNHSELNSHKDLIGGLIISPVKPLQLAVFGWDGNYVKDGLTVSRSRLGFGAKYDGPVLVRTEYTRSHGRKITSGAITGADRADAWYLTCGVPVTNHLRLWGKYDVYRDTKEWDSAKNLYGFTAEYYFCKNLKVQANYTYTYDRLTRSQGKDGIYNTLDLQLYVRF